MRWWTWMTCAAALAACNDGSTEPIPDTDTDTTPDTEVVTYPTPDICINEYMSSNSVAWVLEDTTAPDWFELHNPTSEDVSLDGWFVTDDELEPNKHALPPGLVVPAGGFLLLYADADPQDGPDHVGFNLSKDGEQIGIVAPNGDREIITYGPMATDFSFARSPDCCKEDDCWIAVSGGTPGTTNAP